MVSKEGKVDVSPSTGLYLTQMNNKVIAIPACLFVSPRMSSHLKLTILKGMFTELPLFRLGVCSPATFISTSVWAGLVSLCIGNTDPDCQNKLMNVRGGHTFPLPTSFFLL